LPNTGFGFGFVKLIKSMLKEFSKFLKEYKIIGLGLAFIMGAASTSLVKSLVNDMIMPIITPLIFGESWKNATLEIGPVVLKWGSFLAELINFTILAFIVFLIAKKILKEEEVKKK
jgi:large conductance mechanosensitive channel